MITKIESYNLNQNIKEALDLKEYTNEEYEMFENTGHIKMLNNEKIFHGKESNFNGYSWDTVIGSSNGKIYKIAIQIINTDKKLINEIFKNTIDYLIKEMGKYNEHKFLSKRYIWDAKEGNVIYEQLNNFGVYCINIFLTASSIYNQVEDYFLNIKRSI